MRLDELMVGFEQIMVDFALVARMELLAERGMHLEDLVEELLYILEVYGDIELLQPRY